ncbi:hypothetical protein [Helicobacter suis]|uniref:hypothetical protein n=1 Tax=Helicobacter suis TaxID=104628 RepID=UPI0013D818FA|nr:hypothetical protein [Helicobacter suis]
MKIIDELLKENFSYLNDTNEAIDILVSITGCCGDTNWSWQDNIFVEGQGSFWNEGSRGCSVRIYTTRLNIDMIILGGAGSAKTIRHTGWLDYHEAEFDGSQYTDSWARAQSMLHGGDQLLNVWIAREYSYGSGREYTCYRTYRFSWNNWQWGAELNKYTRPVGQGQSSSFVTTLRPGESIKVDFLDNGAKTGYQLSIYSLESNGGVPFDPELLKVFEKDTDTAPTTDKQDSPQVPTESATESTENPTQEQDVKGTNPS